MQPPVPQHPPPPMHTPSPSMQTQASHAPSPAHATSLTPPPSPVPSASSPPTPPVFSPSSSSQSSPTVEPEPITTTPSATSDTTNPSPRPTTRTRVPNPKYFNDQFVNCTTAHPISPSLVPNTYLQASKDPLWRKAMDDEYNALIHNHTWELVPASTHNPIGCKWIFRIKRHPDGTVDKYKARLVAKGFHQQYGKDYFDTFSPVTKPVTIRTVLSIALSRNWSLRQLDVNNAFLHGHLQEEVYMTQRPGYSDPNKPNHLCKLTRSLYGLKQAPRAWYLALTSFLQETGFKKSLADASLFIYNANGVVCYFMVYVDDIILTANDQTFADTFVSNLAARFSIKDLGYPSHFLGVELIPTTNGLFLSQHRHIFDLLVTHNMDGAKPVQTPLCTSQALTLEDGTAHVDPTPYRQLVGSLQYLAFTRPDIAFAVNKLAQFMHQPTQTHWQALKRLLRYLKGTVYHGLFLNKKSPLTLAAFSDSDWGGSLPPVGLLPGIFFIWAQTSSPGNPPGRNPSLGLPRRPNTRPLPMPRPNLRGFKISYRSLVFTSKVLPRYIVIIRVPPMSAPIQFTTRG
ncbi:hypothetical protein SSX86_020199 [Deinandra increscens subsp. villosa]|uniref:Reverse transcriptase Ty1/copia-type domain-containing protein n=1 Tax=Deinandra increscens subsp. villosa TaxID=3103831 RepID=A0AAP0CSN7_9ASTR